MTATAAETAAALRVSISLLNRRLRQRPPEHHSELPLAQRAALARLDHNGPMTSAALARLEGISAQSMGATLTMLTHAGLVTRSADPADARQVIVKLTAAGRRVLRSRRDARVRQLAAVLSREFTAAELDRLAEAAPLLERLGQCL